MPQALNINLTFSRLYTPSTVIMHIQLPALACLFAAVSVMTMKDITTLSLSTTATPTRPKCNSTICFTTTNTGCGWIMGGCYLHSVGLFVCNHIAFSRWRPWHIPYIFPPRFFRNIKKQKQSRESSSPKTKENRQKTTSTFTPPHHSTPRDLSSPPPPPLR